MRTLLLPLFLLVAGGLTSCAATGACCDAANAPQTVVDNVAKANPAVTRLTIHCAADGSMKVCASTVAEKVGKASDPEDKKALETGQEVVLEENGGLDITLPICMKDGKATAVCGVTMKTDGMTREQAIAKAKEIAKAVDGGLGGTCSGCGDDETEGEGDAAGCCSDKGDKAAGGSCCGDKGAQAAAKPAAGGCCCAKK
ncbi:MAG: hypothetical protein FJ301_03585 [Planctomycetes bacterium]|nr:hypothetical protein [Planctomycetota bacterium]